MPDSHDREHGFTPSVVHRIAILALLLLIGIWGDSRMGLREGPPPSDTTSERESTSDVSTEGHTGPPSLTLDLTLDGVMAALGDDMVWHPAEGEENTWVGNDDWTYVVLTGDPLDLSGVHIYHKTPEFAPHLSAEEQEALHETWKEDSLKRIQGFIHRLLPEWPFDELQAWTAGRVEDFRPEACEPYCMDFTLVMDRIVMLSEYPDETLSAGLFSLGDVLYAASSDVEQPGLNVTVDDVLTGLAVGEEFVLHGTPRYERGLPVFTGVDPGDGKKVELKGNPFNLQHVNVSMQSAFRPSGAVHDHTYALLGRFVAMILPDDQMVQGDEWLSDAMLQVSSCTYCSTVGLLIDDAVELRMTRAEDVLSISAYALGP